MPTTSDKSDCHWLWFTTDLMSVQVWMRLKQTFSSTRAILIWSITDQPRRNFGVVGGTTSVTFCLPPTPSLSSFPLPHPVNHPHLQLIPSNQPLYVNPSLTLITCQIFPWRDSPALFSRLPACCWPRLILTHLFHLISCKPACLLSLTTGGSLSLPVSKLLSMWAPLHYIVGPLSFVLWRSPSRSRYLVCSKSNSWTVHPPFWGRRHCLLWDLPDSPRAACIA